MPPSRPRPLAEVARDLKRGAATPQDLFEVFVEATVYSPAPPQPGVHVLRWKGEQVVPVFSSEAELAKFMGTTRWFSTDGLDLLALLPRGVTIGLDMASPHRLQLDPAAVRVQYALYLPAPGRGAREGS
jgi:hypothetical protein